MFTIYKVKVIYSLIKEIGLLIQVFNAWREEQVQVPGSSSIVLKHAVKHITTSSLYFPANQRDKKSRIKIFNDLLTQLIIS